MVVDDEHPAHCNKEVDSVNTETERLLLTLTEETVDDPASMESLWRWRARGISALRLPRL
jgi:hypothetical protein